MSASLILPRRPKRDGGPPTRPPPLIPAGLALAFCFVLSLLAIAARGAVDLAWLTLADGVFLLVNRIDRRSLLRAARVLLWQTAFIAGLYLLRFGPAEGLWPGLRTSWQLLLAFLPGLALAHGASQARLARALARILPHRTAFALTISLKFVPLLLRQIGDIYEAQVLRGARILPRDLLRPRNWPELLRCLVVPAVVEAMALAENIALAARAREFGRYPRRTCWPENPVSREPSDSRGFTSL